MRSPGGGTRVVGVLAHVETGHAAGQGGAQAGRPAGQAGDAALTPNPCSQKGQQGYEGDDHGEDCAGEDGSHGRKRATGSADIITA